MIATYRAVMLTRQGGPKALEVLELVDLPVEEPARGQARVRVRATGIGSTDFAVVAGTYRYGPKIPFVPGYEIAGVVDAVGPGVEGLRVGQRVAALTVYGGFGEMLVRDAGHFVPIPDGVSDRDAAAVILNYVTAYQAIHRVAKVRAGQTALVTGAAGGVGTAMLQLLRLAGVKTYGAASSGKHATVRALGAVPIDYRAGKLDRLVRAHEPSGVDFVFDGIGGATIAACIGALRRNGHLVAYGFMAVTGLFATLAMFANILIGSRLRGRRGSFYGISALYRKNPKPLLEDLPKVFALVAEKKIDPLVKRTFPLLEARKALELLAGGTVEGKIVLEEHTQDVMPGARAPKETSMLRNAAVALVVPIFILATTARALAAPPDTTAPPGAPEVTPAATSTQERGIDLLPTHHFTWAPTDEKRVQLGVNFGLLQIAEGGFNVAGELRYRRLWLEYSHGMDLTMNKLGGVGLSSAERSEGVHVYVPYTTGFGVGVTLLDELWLGVEFKTHRYDVNAPGGPVASYQTYSVGPVLGYKAFIWKGLFADAYLRYWPNVASTLPDNKIALQGTNGTVEHSAHDFGVFANVSIGYAFDL